MPSEYQRNHPILVAMTGAMAAAGVGSHWEDPQEAIRATGHICARAATVPAHLVAEDPIEVQSQAADLLWWFQGNEPPEWLPFEFQEQVLHANPKR